MIERFSFPRWKSFLIHAQKDAKLWLFCVFLLEAFRIIFIINHHYIITEEIGPIGYLRIFGLGMLFDLHVSSWFVAVPFVFSLFCGYIDRDKLTDLLRKIAGYVFFYSFLVAAIINYRYFGIFHEQVNDILFQIFYDDTTSCLFTEFDQFYWFLYFIVIAIIVFVGKYLINRFVDHVFFADNYLKKLDFVAWKKNLSVLLISLFFLIAALPTELYKFDRHRPPEITKSEFLNINILNPYLFIYWSVRDYLYSTTLSAGLDTFLPDRDVAGAAKSAFSTNMNFNNLDEYFLRTASGSQTIPPKHIFLILGESYDGWPMMKEYESLKIVDNLKYFAANGIYIENFLPSSINTIFSFGVIATGLPYSGKLINYHHSSLKPYPTSIAENFKHLGYRTRFFYGGYATWQRIGDFCTAQGFDEVYLQNDSNKAFNPWGIDDKLLFDQVEKDVIDSCASFNVILTTSNHLPYHLLPYYEQKGFRMKEIPEDIKHVADKTFDMHMIASKWYEDKCIGDFVRNIEKKVERPLFAITGDHYGRRFINANPQMKEKSVVPFVLYGKEVLEGVKVPEKNAGSHLDIAPTLIELCAPKGFKYYTLGRNILSENTMPVGIARNMVITPDYLIDIVKEKYVRLNNNLLDPDSLKGPDISRLRKLHNQLHGISWWRVENGNSIRIDK